MHISLVVSGIGAIVAAIGSGVLLARCFREPRSDLVAFALALIGLLISLGSQAVGYLAGFDGTMFRAMVLGGEVIAPLALILGLSEIGARTTAARFCARLYIPALGLIGVVVLGMDQLTQTTFGKVWPDPAVVYQAPPNYVLEFAIGPATALVAIIVTSVVMQRAGQPDWNAVLPAALMGGVAALLLAYPALAELAAYKAKIHLPVASVYAVCGTVAAILTWAAGARAGRVPLASRRSQDERGWRGDQDNWQYESDRADPRRFEPAVDGGVYRGGGLYRPDPPGRTTGTRNDHDDDWDLGWRDAPDRGHDQGGGEAARDGSRDWRDGSDRDDWRDGSGRDDWRDGSDRDDWRDGSDRDHWRADPRAAGHDAPEFAAGDFATGDFVRGDYADEFGRGHGSRDWAARADEPDRLPAMDLQARGDGLGGDRRRAQLFGQIAIFTLLEDRVEDFDELTRRVVEQVRSRESDTLVYIVHAVPSAPLQRILYEVYRDRGAYQRHIQQPHVQQYEAEKRPYVLATNVVELGLQEASVSPFPSVSELFDEPGYDTAGFERPDYLRDYGRRPAQPSGGSREYR